MSISTECASGASRCSDDESTCVNDDQICDGIEQCANGRDEEGCPGTYTILYHVQSEDRVNFEADMPH